MVRCIGRRPVLSQLNSPLLRPDGPRPQVRDARAALLDIKKQLPQGPAGEKGSPEVSGAGGGGQNQPTNHKPANRKPTNSKIVASTNTKKNQINK